MRGGGGVSDLDRILFFCNSLDHPESGEDLPRDIRIGVVRVKNLMNEHAFHLNEDWIVSPNKMYVKLEDVANIRNGQSITEADVVTGNFPVIAGGKHTIPYFHNKFNCSGRAFTVSKSGAYSGYIWWHDGPIWASDSIVIQSNNEEKYLSRYLFYCMKSKQDEIYQRQQGTGQPHIYIRHIRDFPIPVVSIEEQRDVLAELETASFWLRQAEKDFESQESEMLRFVRTFW